MNLKEYIAGTGPLTDPGDSDNDGLSNFEYQKTLSIIALLACLQSFAFSLPQKGMEQCPITPDEKIQGKINDLLDISSEEQWYKEFNSLKALAGEATTDLIPQVLFYQSQNRKDEKKLWGSEAILGMLLKESDTDDLLEMLLPYSDTKHKWTKKRLHNIFDWSFYRKEDRRYDFRSVESLIRQHKSDLPRGLIEYMYNRSPAQTFLTFMNALEDDKQKQETLLSAADSVYEILEKRRTKDDYKIKKEIVDQLEILSRKDSWWIRIFVACANDQFMRPKNH